MSSKTSKADPEKKYNQCEGCAHDNYRAPDNGCGILKERPRQGPCWARLTPQELEQAEEAIDKYKYHMTGKQPGDWRKGIQDV